MHFILNWHDNWYDHDVDAINMHLEKSMTTIQETISQHVYLKNALIGDRRIKAIRIRACSLTWFHLMLRFKLKALSGKLRT